MITRENIKALLLSLTEEEVQTAINGKEDWILMILHVSNSGYVVTLESRDYEEEIDLAVADNGDLFCDKDTFLQLAKECGINWNL